MGLCFPHFLQRLRCLSRVRRQVSQSRLHCYGKSPQQHRVYGNRNCPTKFRHWNPLFSIRGSPVLWRIRINRKATVRQKKFSKNEKWGMSKLWFEWMNFDRRKKIKKKLLIVFSSSVEFSQNEFSAVKVRKKINLHKYFRVKSRHLLLPPPQLLYAHSRIIGVLLSILIYRKGDKKSCKPFWLARLGYRGNVVVVISPEYVFRSECKHFRSPPFPPFDRWDHRLQILLSSWW